MAVFYIYVGSVLLNLILFHILKHIDEDFRGEFEGDEGIVVVGASLPLANIIILVFLCKALLYSMVYNIKNY